MFDFHNLTALDEAQSGGGTAATDAAQPGGTTPRPTLDEWLAAQSDEVRQRFGEIGGLKKALEAERKRAAEGETAAKELAKLKEKEKKREEAELSEAERLKAALAERDAELERLKAENKNHLLRRDFTVAARELKITWVSAEAEEDAFEHLTRGAKDDSQDVKSVLQGIVKARPYLTGQLPTPQNIDGGGRGSETPDAAIKRIVEEKQRTGNYKSF